MMSEQNAERGGLTADSLDAERLRAFIEALPGLALIIDEDGRYVEVMTTRESLLVERAEALIGRTVMEVLPSDKGQKVLDVVRDVIESGEQRTHEYDVDAIAGRVWFEATVVPFPQYEDAEKRAVIWLAQDISSRKLAELALTKKNEELHQFSYVAAHDLRSPLIAIERAARWLDEENGDALDDDGRQYLDIIMRRAGRMQRLISGLLEYARTAQTLEPSPVDTRQLLEHAIELAQTERGNVEVEIAGEMPTMRTDAELFRQIFQNLIGNAIKHHDKEHGRVTISYERHADEHVFAVSDDGPGIAPAYHDRIFEIFQTLRSKDEAEASGVGLSIVKKAVDALSGTIEIVDSQERGATFRVALP